MSSVTLDKPAQADRDHWLTMERMRVYSWMAIAIFVVVVAVWTALSLPSLVDPRGKPVGYDFIAFWSAARLAVEGHPADVYNWIAIEAAHRVAVPTLGGKVFLWHYPPTYLLMVWPLGLMPYVAALVTFLAATAALWAGVVRSLFADRRAWIVAAAMPAGLINLLDGQNGFLTAALAGFALLALDPLPIVAGALIGLLAIKPHLAVLFPVALVAAGRWRVFASAAVTTIVFVGVSIAACGWPTVQAFLHDLPTVGVLVDSGDLPWGTMPSPYVFVLSLGLPASIALGLQLLVAGAAAICVWLAWRTPDAPFEARAAVLVIASLLVSPYVFYYDLTWAGLGIGWLVLLGLRLGFRPGERNLLFLGWLTPCLMVAVRAGTSIQIGFPVLVMLLLLAMTRAIRVDDWVAKSAVGRFAGLLTRSRA